MSYIKRAYDLIHTETVNYWAYRIAETDERITDDIKRELKNELWQDDKIIVYLEQLKELCMYDLGGNLLEDALELFGKRVLNNEFISSQIHLFPDKTVSAFNLPKDIDDVIDDRFYDSMRLCKSFEDLEKRVERSNEW